MVRGITKSTILLLLLLLLLSYYSQRGNLTDGDNYGAIAISNVETKILETIFLGKFNKGLNVICTNSDSRKGILLDYVQVLLKEPLIII